MPETETVMINNQPVIIEKMITSGDLLVTMTTTICISLLMAAFVLYFFGGRK